MREAKMTVTSVSTIAAHSKQVVDPFSVEVVRQGLASIAEEMTLIVMRAARSPVLREAGDLSSAITDARGGIIAQGRDLPVHLGVMAFTVKALIKYVGQQNIRYGDVWIVNHPEVGGNHLPDVKVIRPIFRGPELIAFGISLAHWADVGGGTPGSYNAGATDAWQEGLQIPPVRLMQQNEVCPEIMSFIKANVRGESEREGDILAQVACCMLADKRVNELVDRLSLETFLGAVVRIHEVSEQQVRRVLSSIPDGRYHGEDFIDGDGRGGPPVRIAVDIEIEGDQAVFDFSASGDSILAPLNTTAIVAQTSVIYVLKSISTEDMFHSDGCFRPIEVITRRGSILNPAPGYPLAAGNHETSQRIVDAVIRALSSAIPERVCAGGCGTAGLLIFSGRDPRGQWWTFYETHGGGEGAHMERDGHDATRVHLSNMANTPSEVVEAEYPIEVLRYAIRDDSGGKGKHQGGKGLVREYKVLSDQVTLTTIFERGVIPPYGLFGGEDGAPFKVTLQRGAERIPLSGCQNLPLGSGDIVLIETAGGGGFGSLARMY
jgi:N-methylhydantoinase B